MDVISVNFEVPQAGIPYTNMGSSPGLFCAFSDWLRSNKEIIRNIDISIFLFNNQKLYGTLLDLANSGVIVNIYSIPLEGYDKKEAQIVDSDSGRSLGAFSKYSLADELYRIILENPHPNLNLFIFPHTYVRSKNMLKFSRGELPYSLHIKHFAATLENGDMISGMASSNLAVRDEAKIETAIIARLSPREAYSTRDFYAGLRENSIPLCEFTPGEEYPLVMRAIPQKSRAMYFAPFYFDSPVLFEEHLKTMVRNARERIIVCGQHVCAFDYSIPSRYTIPESRNRSGRSDGFLANVLAKSAAGVDVQVISQTYCDQRKANDCRGPRNRDAFVHFAEAARLAGCTHYVNKKIHSKFIVIDDITIMTTANFTPTQFIYLPNVDIPEYNYRGVHSEVGSYFVFSDRDLADRMVEHYRSLLSDPETKLMLSEGQYR